MPFAERAGGHRALGPSGPFSGRVSGAAESLVFSPKWKVWGAGAGKGPLPTATHARIVVSKIELTSAPGKKIGLFCSHVLPPPLRSKAKNIFWRWGERQKEKKLQGKEIASIRAPARAKGMFNECIKPFDHPRLVGFSSAGRLVAYPVADLKFDQQRGHRKEKHFNGNQ